MMNLPISETLAARVVLSYLYRSGWIDNITVHPFPVALGVPELYAAVEHAARDQRLS